MKGYRLGKGIPSDCLWHLRQVVRYHHASLNSFNRDPPVFLLTPYPPFFFNFISFLRHLSTLNGICRPPTLAFKPLHILEYHPALWGGINERDLSAWNQYFFDWSNALLCMRSTVCFPCPHFTVGPCAPALLLMLYNLKNYAWLDKCRGPCLY